MSENKNVEIQKAPTELCRFAQSAKPSTQLFLFPPLQKDVEKKLTEQRKAFSCCQCDGDDPDAAW